MLGDWDANHGNHGNHGNLRGPFAGNRLTGLDVFYLAKRTDFGTPFDDAGEPIADLEASRDAAIHFSGARF